MSETAWGVEKPKHSLYFSATKFFLVSGTQQSEEKNKKPWKSLNKAASAPQGALQSLMRPESRESQRSYPELAPLPLRLT